jgi:hypothetical protein
VSQKLDLIRFSEVSRRYHRLARPKIFEVITIQAPVYLQSSSQKDALRVKEFYLQPFPSTFDREDGPLRYIKSIRAATGVDQGRIDCCLHREFRGVPDSSSDSDSDREDGNQTERRQPPPPPDDIETYGSLILVLLKLLEPGSLRSFQ